MNKYILFIISIFLFFNILLSKEKNVFTIPEDTTTILFGGDTHFLWGVKDLQKKSSLDSPITLIKPFFERFHYRVLNIETVISKEGISRTQKNYVFRSDPENIQVLKKLNVDLSILGNNHIYDLGHEGLLQTIDFLKKNEINVVGAGKNLKEAIEPHIQEINKIKFAFFSISLITDKDDIATDNKSGTIGNHPLLIKKIQEIRKSVDYIFLNIHWGEEYNPFITKEQKQLAQYFLKNGVDFIVGHHPHIPQAIEVFSNKAIVYSLGNFLFGSANYLQNNNILSVFHFDKEKKFIGVEVIPITGIYRKYGYQIQLPDMNDIEELFKELYYLSKLEKNDQNIFISNNGKSLFFKVPD